jgi:hypothetical protein
MSAAARNSWRTSSMNSFSKSWHEKVGSKQDQKMSQFQDPFLFPIPRTFPCPSISFRRCQRGLFRRWR